MASIPKQKQKDRERQIRAFMTRARTSQRPNTTPANLTKKPGIPAGRRFDATATFKRSNYPEDDPRWINTGIIPGYGQFSKRQQQSKIAANTRPRFGNREGIPPASRAARKGTPYRRSRRSSRLRGSRYN